MHNGCGELLSNAPLNDSSINCYHYRLHTIAYCLLAINGITSNFGPPCKKFIQAPSKSSEEGPLCNNTLQTLHSVSIIWTLKYSLQREST